MDFGVFGAGDCCGLMFFDPDFLGLLRPGYDFLFYFVKFYGFLLSVAKSRTLVGTLIFLIIYDLRCLGL